MADQLNTVSRLDGLFKIVYADKIKDAIPNWAILQADIPFSMGERLGEEFWAPVVLQKEQGVVYAASGDGAFSLTSVEVKAAVIQKAKIKGSQIVMRAQMDYESAHSAEAGGRQAFENSTGVVVRNMWESMRRRVELELLYGQNGLGIISTENATNKTVTISAATWATGIWAGMEKAAVNLVASNLTSLNGTAGAYITAISVSTRTLTLTTAIASQDATNRVIFKTNKTASGTAWKSCQGAIAMLNGPTAIHGITCATYSAWNPNTKDIGTWGFSQLLAAVTEAVGRGLDDDVNAYISPAAFDTLATTEATYRSYDKSYSPVRFETGAEQLVFHGQTGKITVKPHPFLWPDIGLIMAPKYFKRIGATDVTFDRAAMSGVNRPTSYFRELETKAGYELRCYSHQALFCEAPGKAVYMYGIA